MYFNKWLAAKMHIIDAFGCHYLGRKLAHYYLGPMEDLGASCQAAKLQVQD